MAVVDPLRNAPSATGALGSAAQGGPIGGSMAAFTQAQRAGRPVPQSGTVTVQAILDEAARHLGAAYNAGAGRTWSAQVDNPTSFDCSGLWLYVARRTGAGEIGWVSDAQYKTAADQGLAVTDMDLARRTPGVMLFKPGQGPNGHVAVVYNTDGDTIESTRGGVQIIKGGAFKQYYTQAAYMPGVDYSGGGIGGLSATGQDGGPVDMQGANDAYADPAFQMAALAALINGTPPEQLEVQAAGGTVTSGGTTGTAAASGDWRSDLLTRLGYQPTEANLRVLDAWHRAEGGDAADRNNWLNTTQSMDGAESINSHGVRRYTSYEQGLDATVKTLQNGRYQGILTALERGDDPYAVADAIEQSPWGTGGLVRKVLG